MRRNKALAVIVRLAGGGIQILSVFLISRVLGIEAVGVFGLAMAFAILMGGCLSLGLPNYLIHVNSVHYAQQNLSAFRYLVAQSAKIIIVFSVVLQLLMLLTAFALPTSVFEQYTNHYILMSAPTAGLFFGLASLAVMNLRAMQYFVTANILDRPLIGILTTGFFLLAALLFAGRQDIQAPLSVICAGTIVALLGLGLIWRHDKDTTRSQLLVRPSFNWGLVASYFFALITEILLARAPLVFASFFHTPAVLGLFQIAFTLSIGLIIFQEALGGIFGPKFAVDYDAGRYYRIRQQNRRAIGLLLGVSVLYCLPFILAPTFFIGLMSPSLSTEPAAFFVILGAVVFRCGCGLYRSIFEATGKIRVTVWISIISLVVLLVTIMLFQEQGVLGLAWAWAIATMTHSAIGLVTSLFVLRDKSGI